MTEESEHRGRLQKGGRGPDHLRLWFSFQPRRLWRVLCRELIGTNSYFKIIPLKAVFKILSEIRVQRDSQKATVRIQVRDDRSLGLGDRSGIMRSGYFLLYSEDRSDRIF